MLTQMAKKPPPPPSSSSEEEENESSSSDQEEEQKIPPKPAPQTLSKPESDDSETDESDSDSDDSEPVPQKIQPAPSKESESGSESGSGSESDPGSAKLVPPISSMPMAPPAEPEHPVPKSSEPTGNNNNNGNKLNGKPFFQRIWSLDDEITILESIAKYQSEHGPVKAIPGAIGCFCDFVKGRLSFEVTGTQLADKIRRLKRKYSLMAARAREGKAAKLARSHDKKVYELSEKLWRKDGEKGKEVAETGAATSGRARKGKREWPLLRDALERMGNKMVVSELLEGVDGEKAEVWERKLKKQKEVEIKHQVSRADLIGKSIKLVWEGLERANY